MPRNLVVPAVAGAWTQLTNADVTAATVQNKSGYSVRIMATVGATPPATADLGHTLGSLDGLAADMTFAQLFPGVVGGNRLWVWGDIGGEAIWVSHA